MNHYIYTVSTSQRKDQVEMSAKTSPFLPSSVTPSLPPPLPSHLDVENTREIQHAIKNPHSRRRLRAGGLCVEP